MTIQIPAPIHRSVPEQVSFDRRELSAILTLYDALMAMRPGPMVALNRAMALAEVEAKFHLMANPLPAARRAALWQMRRQLLRSDLPFADFLALVHPAVEVRYG